MLSTAHLRAAFASSWAQSSHLVKVSAASMVDVVGGKTVPYENLQRPNWQPECASTIILNTAMDLTCKNQGFHYDSGGRIKSWNFRSVPNIIIHILKIPVNSYNSNGAFPFLYLLWGTRNGTCCFSVYLLFPWNPLNVLGHIIRRSKRYFQGEHNAIGTVRNGSELMEKFQEEVLQI